MEKHFYTVRAKAHNPNGDYRFHNEFKEMTQDEAQSYANYLQTTELAKDYYKKAAYEGLKLI